MKEKSYLSYFFLLLYFLLPIIPVNNVVDRVGFDWLYLSVVNIAFFSITIKNNYQNFYSENKLLLISIAAFIIFSFFSFFQTQNITESIYELTHYITYFASFLVIYYLLNNSNFNFRIIILFILVFGFIEVIIPLLRIGLDYFNGISIERSRKYSGFAGNINILSYSVVLKLPVFYYGFIRMKKSFLIKALIILNLFLSLILIFLLQSRGGYLALILSSLTFFSYILIKQKKYVKHLILFISIILLSFSFIYQIQTSTKTTTFFDRAETITDYSENESINSRLRFYKDAINSSLENPLFGVGIGNWKLSSIEPRKDTINEYIVPYHAHNDFLQILVEIGFFGLIGYLIFYFYPLIHNYRNRLRMGYFVACSCFLVFLVDSNLNFPIARPYNFIQYFIIINLLMSESKKNEIL